MTDGGRLESVTSRRSIRSVRDVESILDGGRGGLVAGSMGFLCWVLIVGEFCSVLSDCIS